MEDAGREDAGLLRDAAEDNGHQRQGSCDDECDLLPPCVVAIRLCCADDGLPDRKLRVASARDLRGRTAGSARLGRRLRAAPYSLAVQRGKRRRIRKKGTNCASRSDADVHKGEAAGTLGWRRFAITEQKKA